MIFEDLTSKDGLRSIKRVKTWIIVLTGFLCFPLGIFLLLAPDEPMFFGAILTLTVCPCLLLYPIIRFFFFGGKDSVAAVVTTVVVEEVVKAAIHSAASKKGKN